MVAEIRAIKEQLRERQEKKIEEMLRILKVTKPLEVGIYGSYARNEYKATSDIDMYVLYTTLPSKIQKGELYENAEELGIDLLITEYDNFYTTDSIFCRNVRRDKKVIWRKEACDESK